MIIFSNLKKIFKHSNSNLSIVLSLALFISAINITIPAPQTYIITSGITATVEEAANTIKGFGRFLDSLKLIIEIISNVITLEALLLFIAASVIGFGLSFLGMPRNVFSFFLSLVIADFFWFTWVKSFNTIPADLLIKLYIMAKANLIIIIPFIIIGFFKSAAFRKKLVPKIKTVFKKRSGMQFNKKEIALLEDELNSSYGVFQKFLLNDILNKKDKDSVEISPATINSKKILEAVLKKFEKPS